MKSLTPVIDCLSNFESAIYCHADIEAMMKGAGFKFLGAGCYASVFLRNLRDRNVVKVGGRLRDKWLRYAMWIKANKMWQVNACFPKIGTLHISDNFYAAEIERLFPLRSKEHNDRFEGNKWDAYVKQVNPEVLPPPLANVQMVEALKMLREFFQDNLRDCHADIHSGNVMRRPISREWVISDPIA